MFIISEGPAKKSKNKQRKCMVIEPTPAAISLFKTIFPQNPAKNKTIPLTVGAAQTDKPIPVGIGNPIDFQYGA